MIHLPNILTVLRIILIPFISFYYLRARYDLAFLTLMVAGFSDFFDGALARKYQVRTKVGAFLDPAADKFLMFFTYLTLGWTQQIPFYVVGLVIGRDVYIVLGYLFLKTKVDKIEIRPLMTSKLNTFCQLALLSFSLLYSYIQMHPWKRLDVLEISIYWVKEFSMACVILFTVLSGVNYTRVGWRIFKSSKSKSLSDKHV